MPRRFTKEDRSQRARMLYLVVGGIVLLLLGRLGELQLARGGYYRTRSQENRIRSEILPADRGRILDRTGTVLADDYPSSQLLFDAEVFRGGPDSLRAVMERVGRILDRPADDLVARVAARSGRRPVVLTRILDFGQVSQIEERIDRLPGVQVAAVPVRRYPEGRLGAHLLGYLGEIGPGDLAGSDPGVYQTGDLIGKTGIERQYESVLRGRDGEAYVEVDARGRRTRTFPELPARPAAPGHDVVLTIDAELQAAAEAALAAIRPHGGKDGHENDPAPASTLVALDPRTGEVLALASYPSYDPNVFVGGLSTEEYASLQAPGHPQQFRAIQSTYPPASTFKIVTSLAAMDQGIAGPETVLEPCWGRWRFGDRYFRCWKRAGHGSLDHKGALRQSCDVFYYQLGDRLGVEGLSAFAQQLRLHEKTGIDLPGERADLIPTPEWYRDRWGGFGRGVALNLSIGQGELLLSPIALARFYAAIANGGVLVQPHLLAEVWTREGQRVRDARAEDWTVGRIPVPAENLAFVGTALEEVVMHARGTGGRARVGDIRIAGKTGTAENPGDDHALFACYAPAEAPTIVVVVVAENAGHGGAVAAPAARQVLESYFARRPDLALQLEEAP